MFGSQSGNPSPEVLPSDGTLMAKSGEVSTHPHSEQAGVPRVNRDEGDSLTPIYMMIFSTQMLETRHSSLV